MSTPHLIPGKFVWFEYAGNDVETAQAFYAAVFGWRTVAYPMGRRRRLPDDLFRPTR